MWREGSLSAALSSPPPAPRSQSCKDLWVVCVKPWELWRVMVSELRQDFPPRVEDDKDGKGGQTAGQTQDEWS